MRAFDAEDLPPYMDDAILYLLTMKFDDADAGYSPAWRRYHYAICIYL